MIRASGGVWLSYLATFVFQVVFASRYGTGAEATAFVVTFALAVTVAGVFTSTALSIVVPRLVNDEGLLARGPLHLIAALIAGGVAVVLGLVVASGPLGTALGGAIGVPDSLVSSLLLASTPFVFLQLLAGQLMAVLLAQGRRFLPLAGAAVPSVFSAALLIHDGSASGADVYMALGIGSTVEVLLLATGIRRPIEVGEVHTEPVASTALGMLGVFLLLSLIPPIERVVASTQDTAGGAEYFYASRSLAVVQQLLIGGAALASLGDWSAMLRTFDRSVLARSVASRLAAAGVLLAVASAIAVVAAPEIVALVYERGQFTASDTDSVSLILLIALPGFVAEGLSLIVGQALLAARETRVAIGIGYGNFALRLTAVIVFGAVWGAVGVAAGYSLATVGIFLAQVFAAARRSLVTASDTRAHAASLVLAGGTLASAGLAAASALSTPVQVAVVVGTFVALTVALWSRLSWPTTRDPRST